MEQALRTDLNERLKVYSPLLGMKEKHETVQPEVWLERRAAPTGAGTCQRWGLADALHADKNSRMVGPEPPEARAGVPAADVDIRVNSRKSRLIVGKATRGRTGEVSVSPSRTPSARTTATRALSQQHGLPQLSLSTGREGRDAALPASQPGKPTGSAPWCIRARRELAGNGHPREEPEPHRGRPAIWGR